MRRTIGSLKSWVSFAKEPYKRDDPWCNVDMQYETYNMRWLRLVGSLKSWVSFAEYRLFYRALLQKRPMFLLVKLVTHITWNVMWVNRCASTSSFALPHMCRRTRTCTCAHLNNKTIWETIDDEVMCEWMCECVNAWMCEFHAHIHTFTHTRIHSHIAASSIVSHTLGPSQDDSTHSIRMCGCVNEYVHECALSSCDGPGDTLIRFVGALQLQVSFAKEPYKRDDILRCRLVMARVIHW